MFDYFVNLEAKVRIGGIMSDHRTNDLFKAAAASVVELYTKVLRTSKKMLSVGDIDKNHVGNE